jgi:hypothetical protein
MRELTPNFFEPTLIVQSIGSGKLCLHSYTADVTANEENESADDDRSRYKRVSYRGHADDLSASAARQMRGKNLQSAIVLSLTEICYIHVHKENGIEVNSTLFRYLLDFDPPADDAFG